MEGKGSSGEHDVDLVGSDGDAVLVFGMLHDRGACREASFGVRPRLRCRGLAAESFDMMVYRWVQG
jgi:hypothetical protein